MDKVLESDDELLFMTLPPTLLVTWGPLVVVAFDTECCLPAKAAKEEEVCLVLTQVVVAELDLSCFWTEAFVTVEYPFGLVAMGDLSTTSFPLRFSLSSTGVTSTSLMDSDTSIAAFFLPSCKRSKSRTLLAGVANKSLCVASIVVGVNRSFPPGPVPDEEAGGVLRTSHVKDVGLWGGGVFSYSHLSLSQSARLRKSRT